MAAAIASATARDRIEAVPAGVLGQGVDPAALGALSAAGIPLPSVGPEPLASIARHGFDIVVTLDPEAREFALAERSASTLDGGQCTPEDRVPVHLGIPVMVDWGIAASGSGFGLTLERLEEHVSALVTHDFLEALVIQRERWEMLLDALEDGVIAHDNSRRIFLMNAAAERITGWPRSEVLGRNCQDIFGSDGLCGSNCSFCPAHDVLADGPSVPAIGPVRTRTAYEVRFTTGDGLDKTLGISVMPMDIRPGRHWGVLATIRDITEVNDLRWKLKAQRSFHGMTGVSEAMREIFDTVRRISTSDYPVLITGESGTGKELVAAAIHGESRRGAGPFVPINCGALPDNILESELFGHVRGAFTGAVRSKKGRFELADGGTIFLDEVGELSPAFQVKLLRVLEQKSFEMVGGEKPIRVDVRVISATNRDLRSMVREGRFREDLFYRLSVVPIDLPPLRARREDIPLIAMAALARIAEETVAEQKRISDDAMDLVLAYSWPGNVRELIHALQFAALRATGPTILPQHLPPEMRSVLPAPALASPPPTGSHPRSGSPGRPGRRPKLTAEAVARALAEAGGNKARAAVLLGVGRATLYRFLGMPGGGSDQ